MPLREMCTGKAAGPRDPSRTLMKTGCESFFPYSLVLRHSNKAYHHHQGGPPALGSYGTPAPALAAAPAVAEEVAPPTAPAPAGMGALEHRPQVCRQKGPRTTSVVLHTPSAQVKLGVGGVSTQPAAGGGQEGEGEGEGGDTRSRVQGELSFCWRDGCALQACRGAGMMHPARHMHQCDACMPQRLFPPWLEWPHSQ